ncbi:hypothetical protein AJ80_03444 [Polytolypa hystricis UAMH7299]|uniref:Uncharacterized protein n=1 Tax=Polytolypa hystricis (strain UAMH7299) TaxID=1447883 RepID=A0A2B7YJL1_POLH7|nr:hypothetical protein AJ80_03444 [Polytolypa hystricis UAMH7299]
MSETVYTSLTEILSNRHLQVLDIEILPPSFTPPLVHDGSSLGITKKALVQAFIPARQIFFSVLKNNNTPQERDDTSPAPERAQTALATEVILIFDSEHLTACNWRKRRLYHLQHIHPLPSSSSSPSSSSRDEYINAIKAEITFTTSLLRSPLHRHAKSPTLWQHRKWVMSQLLLGEGGIGPMEALMILHPALRGEVDGLSTGTVEDLLHAELSVVLRAGEHHPNNYYAFSYIREFMALLNTFSTLVTRVDKQNTTSIAGAEVGIPEFKPLFTQDLAKCILDEIHRWCLVHPRDISGWAFLLFLLEEMGDGDEDNATKLSVVRRTVRYAMDVVWEGESLWTFIDLATREFPIIEAAELYTVLEGEEDTELTRRVGDLALPPRKWEVQMSRTKARQRIDHSSR